MVSIWAYQLLRYRALRGPRASARHASNTQRADSERAGTRVGRE